MVCVMSVLGGLNAANGMDSKTEKAILAGGCFWCVEADFDKIDGVIETVSGYIGGHEANPSYKEVSRGRTGHTEAVEVTFDSTIVSYRELLNIYWRSIDPTVVDRQFCDVGRHYRPEIFYLSDAQKKTINESKQLLMQTKPFSDPILVKITKATPFYPAESYHQNYHIKNPIRYKFYRYNCGRDKRLEMLWGKI